MRVCPLCRIALDDAQPTCPRDGHEGMVAVVDPIPPDLASRFKAIQLFATGETGTLYVVDDVQTGRRGILKLLRSHVVANVAERQRLKRELVKQATLSNPYLALPTVTGESGGIVWLFREWVEGVSLRVKLARGGALAAPEALAIAAQLATALDELHRAGLLHRDLEPGHIILQPQPSGVPRVVVIDASIAGRVETGDVFEVLGTAPYVSPEQASGKLVSFRSDLYALGCVLFEMISGEPPFRADDAATMLRAHVEQPVPPPPGKLPAGVNQLLSSLLAKDPRERPFSAQQVRRALDPFLPDQGSEREPTQAFDRTVPDQPPVVMMDADGGHHGTGTLRPPLVGPKKTILGMPPVAAPSKPPPPPAGGPAAPIVDAGPRKPPPPPGAKSPDTTHELEALDIVEDEVEAKPAALPARPPQMGAPPPPPTRQMPAPPAPPGATPPVAQPPGGRIPVAASGELDYDDLAETMARESPAALAGMQPSVRDTSPGGQAAPGQMPVSPHAPTQAAFPAHPGAAFGSTPGVQSSPGMHDAATLQDQPAYAAPSPIVEDDAPPKKKKGKAGVIFAVVGVVLILGLAVTGGAAWWLLKAGGLEQLAGVGGTEPLLGPVGIAPAAEDPTAPVVPPQPDVASPAQEQPAAEQAAAQQAAAEQAAAEQAAAQQQQVAAREQAQAQAAAQEQAQQRTTERETGREQRTERETAREERAGRGGREAAGAAGGGGSFAELREQALAEFRAGRFREAAALYERATVMNPSHAGSFAGLGAARLQAGDVRGAIVAYQRAIQLQPNHSGFYAALGRAYETAGDRRNAQQAYERAIALDPNNNAARQGLGRVQ